MSKTVTAISPIVGHLMWSMLVQNGTQDVIITSDLALRPRGAMMVKMVPYRGLVSPGELMAIMLDGALTITPYSTQNH